MTVGENIRTWRKMHQYTQVELAAQAGISVNSLRLYESGKRKPNIDTLKKIADVLKIDVTALFSSEDFAKMVISGGHIEYAYSNGYEYNNSKEKIMNALDLLNPSGQQVAVERVEELTEIPKYQKDPPPEDSGNG